MKKLLSILLALIITMSAFMGLGFSVSAENSDVLAVTVDGVTTNVKVGDTFRYTMTLSDVQIVNCQAEVYFDNNFVKVTTVDENDEEAYDAYVTENFPIIYDSVIFNTDLTEKILVNCSRVNKYRFVGEKTLFSFEFTALAAGETTISTTMIEMAKSVTEFYVDKTPDGPVLVEEYTSAEFVTYEAPEEPSTEEPSTEEPSTEEPSTEEPSTEEPTEPAIVKVKNISATAESTTAQFTWDALDGATKYWVYKYNDSNDTWAVAVSSTTTSAVVKNLTGGTAYQFKVIARIGDSKILSLDDADVVNVTTKAPVATESITATTGITSANITWDPIEGATKYWVYKANSESGPYYICGSTTTGTNFVVKKLYPDSTYYFKIQALTHENGTPILSNIDDSPLLTVTTGAAAAITTTAVSNTATSATLSWPAFENADKYWVMYSTTSSDTTDRSHWRMATTTATTYIFNNLQSNTVYYFCVCARYTDADTGKVETIDYIPVMVHTAYSNEDFITFTPVDDTTVTLSWDEIETVAKTWVIVKDADGNQVAIISTTTNSVTIKNLSGYENYTYELKVLDNDGVIGYITKTGGESYHD